MKFYHRKNRFSISTPILCSSTRFYVILLNNFLQNFSTKISLFFTIFHYFIAFASDASNAFISGFANTFASSSASTSSGTHIVINSVRKEAVRRQSYMDKPHEEIAGYKHRSTNKFLNYFKKEIMDMCIQEGLH